MGLNRQSTRLNSHSADDRAESGSEPPLSTAGPGGWQGAVRHKRLEQDCLSTSHLLPWLRATSHHHSSSWCLGLLPCSLHDASGAHSQSASVNSAVKTKCHRLGGLDPRHLFLADPDVGKSKIKVPAGSVLGGLQTATIWLCLHRTSSLCEQGELWSLLSFL